MPEYFYPRPPRGGRPRPRQEDPDRRYTISIHALREEGDQRRDGCRTAALISIHALREEGDVFALYAIRFMIYFYPRPPRGGRPAEPQPNGCAAGFLSTPSARRATVCPRSDAPITSHFYPRPPRGGRRADSSDSISIKVFLSTPSARRATRESSTVTARARHFYPRPPRGGRLCFRDALSEKSDISIHALREEGDEAGVGL